MPTPRRPASFPARLVAALGAPACLTLGVAAGAVADPLPEIARTVIDTMDRTADPCQDFYRHACGGWVDRTALPADQPIWVRSFSVLEEDNRAVLRQLIERAIDRPRDAEAAKVGTYYASCMDQEAIARRGIEPLAQLLARIDSVRNADQALAVAGALARLGAAPFFELAVHPDFAHPKEQIAVLLQGGLGLPDRDDYLSEEPARRELLAAYEGAVATLLGLLGTPAEQAAADARAVVALETRLAGFSRDNVRMRNYEELYHRTDRRGLARFAPRLAWDAYLSGLGAPSIHGWNVATPEYFRGLQAVLAGTPASALRAYLRWHLVNATARLLPAAFTTAHFDFFGRTLSGAREEPARWKRCVGSTEQALPEAVGRLYVAERFAGKSKETALEMIADVERAFEAALPSLAWMDETTRQRAIAKAQAIKNRIGYPERFEDYGTLAIDREAGYFRNATAAAAWHVAQDLAKADGPTDPDEWGMRPQEVNASYNPFRNDMTFPAGILQPPFFHQDFPAAMNYGAMGTVMGHELTHGFDDQGRKTDGEGVLREWWAPAVAERFEARASCVAEQYSAFEVEPGVAVNGRLTLGENIADHGGLKQAWAAFAAWQERHPDAVTTIPDLTPEQLFFVGYAQAWCTVSSPEFLRLLVRSDVHSPPRFRVNGPLVNHPAFGATFQCATGTPMNPAQRCEVW